MNQSDADVKKHGRHPAVNVYRMEIRRHEDTETKVGRMEIQRQI
jgi:hypothetical protein